MKYRCLRLIRYRKRREYGPKEDRVEFKENRAPEFAGYRFCFVPASFVFILWTTSKTDT